MSVVHKIILFKNLRWGNVSDGEMSREKKSRGDISSWENVVESVSLYVYCINLLKHSNNMDSSMHHGDTYLFIIILYKCRLTLLGF